MPNRNGCKPVRGQSIERVLVGMLSLLWPYTLHRPSGTVNTHFTISIIQAILDELADLLMSIGGPWERICLL
jgi:hypothetical protein